MVVNGSYGDYLNQLFWTLRYDSQTRVQQSLSNHIIETFKLINIQFYQNVQYHRFIYWQEDRANCLNWEVNELFYKKCSSLSYCNVMNGVNIEIPDNRNISRITIFNPPPSAAQHQMESSHAWIEMSLNGFSC